MQTKHLCDLIHIRIKGEVGTVKLVKPSSNFLTDCSMGADLLVFLYAMFSCDFCHIPIIWCHGSGVLDYIDS